MIINLPKRNGSDWLEMEDGAKIKIDYPTGKQVHHLQDLMTKSLSDESGMNDFVRYYIKYTVKDWSKFMFVGASEKDAVEVECKLDGNELEEELWYDLTSKPDDILELYTKIEAELGWTDKDKKK